MADLLAKSGDKIDVKKLSEIFGCEVVETSALKGTGLKEVVEKAIEAAKKNEWKNPVGIFSGSVENAIEKVEEAVGDAVDADQKRWFAIKLLEKDSKVIEQLHLPASLFQIEAVAHGHQETSKTGSRRRIRPQPAKKQDAPDSRKSSWPESEETTRKLPP